MTLGDLPPTQLYAAMAFVLSVAALWLNRWKDDAGVLNFMQGLQAHSRFALSSVVCTLLALPIVHVLYVLLAHSTASVGHQIAHAVPLVGSMFAIIVWWMRILSVAPTVEDEDSASP